MAIKLQHHEFAVDCTVKSLMQFSWINVYDIISAMGEYNYWNLATIALRLLAIHTFNADCKKVFSHVRRIKTDFRSTLSPNTISSLIGCAISTT